MKTSRAVGRESYPVLVVPGWGSPMFQTDLVARGLEKEGLQVVRMKLPRLAVGDMERSAEVLGTRVDKTLKKLSCDKVNLVGYSLGGLIARIYLQEFGGRGKLHRAVFVGAPQDGVYIGYLGAFTKSGRQIRKGSEFMRRLNESSTAACDPPRCLSIYLKKDGIILPAESAHLPCGYNIELSWPIFHWGVVFNRRTFRAGARFMKGEVPQQAFAGSEAADRS